ncbi:zinc finger MYM-type protein 2 isoform X1 [Epinephelus moara]|uniref:zinc finger MYM-type protein 2 isoform X1 n=1 Tax=Epinephelus moara TaxID=300413 RepID=UPI00214E59D0|nr:zinc finger MYM-type protein 2 isoform X1 [Epinephelus moara]XP_049905132.1 zinc finger MYM-type protein 2 isoform X1 [Epinephelus moara]
MDGDSEPNPAVAEEAGERVEPMDATPSQEQQTTPPSEEAEEAVSMVTEEDGATKEGSTEDNDDDDVVLVGEEDPQPSATALSQDTPSTDCLELAAAVATVDMSTAEMPSVTPSSPASSSTSTAAAAPPKPPATEAEPIVIDDEEDSEQKDTSSSSPAHPGGSSESHSPGVLSSTEPDSEIRIASVTTLGSSSQKGSATASAVNTPPHPADAQEDMNLMITSVTSLQGGAAAVTAAGEGQAEENGLQISSAFSLNPDTPSGRPTSSFNPGRGSGPMGQLVQNGDTGTHNRADSWISQSASVPRNQKQTGVDSPSPATSLPKPPGQSSSSTSSSGSQPQPRTVKVTCANCKKPLKKGQTAYQRKGSTHLFCSTTCLSAFSHKPAPKKSCTMCKKDITNMKGTIVAQVDSSESFQEFCSTGCLGAYENKQNPPKSGLKTKCTVCGKLTEIRHEVSFKTVTHKICSDTCFNVYRRANGLIMNCCEQCGDYLPSRASANHFLLVDGQQKRFCCQNCIRDYKQAHSKLASCLTCKTLIKTGEVLHSLGAGGTMGSYCSVNCMNKGKLATTSFINTEPTCHFCKRNSLPQYQATLPEGNILNFCSSQCVTKFQNATLQTATNGQTPLSTTNNTVQLKCNYCRGAFSLKPEILEWEDKVYQFCSKTCCEDYKKLHCIVTFCEYCQEEKTLHEMVKFSGVKRPFCSEGCKLLFKQDFIRRLGLKCVSCNHCNQLCKRGLTRQLGGMTRDFCSEACAKKFHDWYYKAARCDCCKVQGNLTESVMWRAEMKHFCDQECLLKFYCQQNEPIMVTQKGPENTTLGYEMQGAKLGLVNQGTVAYAGGGLIRDVKNKAVLCKPLTLTKATYCKPHMQSKLLQTDVDDGVKREYIPVPIPVPVFIPIPMNMYSQVTPTPVSLPVPVPVPVFLPTTLQGAEQIVQTINELKNKVPSDPLEADLISMAEMIAEDQKPDVKPVMVKSEHGGKEPSSSSSEEEEKMEEERMEEEVKVKEVKVKEEDEDVYEPDLDLEADFPQGHNSLSRAEILLNAMVGDISDVEDLSDCDDPGVEQLSYEECMPPYSPESDQQSSDDSDCEPQVHPSEHVQRSRGPACISVDIDNEPGPSEDGHGERWQSGAFTPNLVKFEFYDERLYERQDWQPLDYVEQYIDTDLMKHIAICTNAMSLSTSGGYLNTSVDEIYHFFGATILMSCVPYPQMRMFWSNALRIPAISDKMRRDRFFKLRQHLKVVIDDEISEDMRQTDRFWRTRPFMDRILRGCLLQARPECVSVHEQMIPFTGACPFRQYVPQKPNSVGMKNFVLASSDGIVLDFEVFQGADALSSQVREAGGLGLGALVIEHLAKTLRPGTKVYCDRFFTNMRVVDQMLERHVYLTGTVKKNRITKALQKLPSDQTMKQQGTGTSASVTREDGRVCVVKWFDNKPMLMLSAVHGEQPGDTRQQWSKKDKRHVTVTRPSIVCEYNSKMAGVNLVDRMMNYYQMSVRTKKWTIRMLMHFTDLALANSWLLYRRDNTERGTPREGIMQFLEFRMAVAQAYLAKCNSDVQHVFEENVHLFQQQGKRHQVAPVPHVSVRTTSAAHLPEVVNMKNSMRCREKGCSGKSRVRCVTCNVFLCLQHERNCFAAFHTSQYV